LLSYNKTISNMLFARDAFRLPLTDNVDVSYRLARHGLYQFLNKKLENQLVKEGAYAGFPWFLQIWTRDELVSLKAYMDCGEERFVKEKLMSYLTKIEPETGMLKRIEKEDALYSADGTFWLAKRFDDFFTLLTRRGRLDKIFSKEERLFAFRQLCLAFQSIVEGSWDFQEELLQVKHGDSWMDTLDLHYPVDIQVQFLSFVSFLAKMASQLSLFEEHKKYADFENLYRQKIKKSYFRKGKLFNEVYEDMHTVNVFLCYYLYPDLLLKKDWESAFDAALSEMSSSWGGLASLSTKDSRFEPNYSGENDKSYHRGDSWYWINNYAAMAMQDLNEQKYRKSIRDILHASNRDIMELGTLGFSSELSSFSEQRAQGCFAQLWSHASYIELVDFLFEKKCLGPVLAEQKGELDFFSPFRLKHFAGLKEKISKQLTAMQVKQNFQGMFRRQSN
ncbi:MAG: hypothetical protein KC548_03385, partial [Nanoarchaeota archaeon]|nr:hypothetical protein [Nanoarchaeota archaeon]